MAGKSLAIIVIIAALLCACPVLALAEDAEQSVDLKVVLPQEAYLGIVYDSLFRITNLNYKKGADNFINVTVYYNVTKEGREGAVIESSFEKIVNSYSYASTGLVFLDETGDYTICGWSQGSNLACMNFTVLDPLQIACSVSVNLSLKKLVFANNEKVDIKNVIGFGEGDEFPYILEYWIEDLFGTVVKKRLNTSNDNLKVFTPDVDELDRVFVVKNRLVFTGCNNSNPETGSEALFIIRNQDYKEPEKVKAAAASSQTKKNEIVSFYTRTRNYHPEINLYANVKVKGEATLRLKFRGGEERRDIAGDDKPLFTVPAQRGPNVYSLELYVGTKLADTKSLLVELEGEGNEENISDSASQEEQPVNITETIKPSAESVNASGNILALKNETPDAPEEPVKQEITGDVVFEGSRPKSAGMVPYLLAALVAAGVAGVIKWRMGI